MYLKDFLFYDPLKNLLHFLFVPFFSSFKTMWTKVLSKYLRIQIAKNMEKRDILKKIKDAHYFQLNSQGNVYTLTNLPLPNGTNKILAASLKREIFCFEYPDTISDILTPTTKEVLFTYIPGKIGKVVSKFEKSYSQVT